MRTPKSDDLCRSLQKIASKRFNFASYDRRRMFAPHLVLELAPLGLFGLEVAKEEGGCGLSFVEMMAVEQQLASIDVTLAAFLGIHNALGIHPLRVYGSEAQKAGLEVFARGHALLGFALSEPGAGSDPASLATRAAPNGAGQWYLHGEKIWIGNAAWAQALVVICKTDQDGETPGQFLAFLVPTNRDGVKIGAECETLGLRGIVQNKVSFQSVSVTTDDLIGQPGQGMEVAQSAMQLGRLGIGAIGVGAMKRVLQLMLDFAQHRQIGSRSLAARLAVKQKLFDSAAEVDYFGKILEFLAQQMDEGRELPEFFAIAVKVAVSERAWVCADAGVQLCGGRGYDEANGLARIFRDVRILRIFEGPTEALQAYIGSAVLFAFRSISDGIQAISRDSEEGKHAIREISDLRTRAIAWLRSADPPMERACVEAVAGGLGVYVCWRMTALIHAAAGGNGTPRTIAKLIADSKDAWCDWISQVGDLREWELGLLEQSLLDEIGVFGNSIGDEFMPPDELMRHSKSEDCL